MTDESTYNYDLRDTYTFRPEDLIELLHHYSKVAYIMAVIDDHDPCQDRPEEEDPHPAGTQKQLDAWIRDTAEKISKLELRDDGTSYIKLSDA